MNKLSFESSPYLLQHQHNPVHWLAWGNEALNRAKTENKPIILSIGYSACHWCHVMEHECFEDLQVAELMNEHFINIKIDREERPDIDSIYMDAIQSMVIRGGWPLNVFLTPSQKPFYGGTYFPKRQWMEVLNGVANAFENQHQEIEKTANGIAESLNANQNYGVSNRSFEINTNIIHAAALNISQYFDTENGGLLRSPKFPMPCIWDFMITYNSIFKNEMYANQIELTLDRIVLGGIFDHVGGGWTRYSTDEFWKVPHFEKMLYDNGQLVSIYAQFLKFNGTKKLYEWSLSQTLNWLGKYMTNADGGFYAALDADSENEEGKYYIWKKEEIKSILGPNADSFNDLYNITEEGNWEHGNNILHLEQNFELNSTFQENLERLYSYRKNRIMPGLDNKIICSWNAIMLNGLIDYAKQVESEKLSLLIQSNLSFIESHLCFQLEKINPNNNHRLGHLANNKSLLGFLDDYTFLIKAYINYYKYCFDEAYLFKAESLLKYASSNFYDEKDDLFFYTDIEAEKLISRKKEVHDNVIPSSNAIMAHNLFELGRLFYNDSYMEIAQRMYVRFDDNLAENAQWLVEWAHLGLKMSLPKVEVIITGNQFVGAIKELENQFPMFTYAGAATSSQLAIFEDKVFNEELQIYVCIGKTCQLPSSSISEIQKLLANIDL